MVITISGNDADDTKLYFVIASYDSIQFLDQVANWPWSGIWQLKFNIDMYIVKCISIYIAAST